MSDQPVAVQPDFADLAPLLPAVVKESKAGYKTTEFWLTIGGSLLIWLDAVPLPEKYEGFVMGAIGLTYILSRGIAKQGVPVVEENPAAAIVPDNPEA